jgi:signal transduction histidine kinase
MDKARILVVDDTPANLEILGDLLKPEYHVHLALNGLDALKLASSDTAPDLLLLDIMMPGLDGYQVCEALKAREETRHIPIIFVTAVTDIESEEKGLSLGAVDYITKPFTPSIVLARVKTHLKLHNQTRHLQSLVKERTAELEKARLEAEAANRAKSVFLANMSHELRTPLNGVIGMLESVLLTGADTEWESKLSAALEAAEHLARLVDDVLDFSRVEADKMTLDSTPFDLRRLSSSIDNILRPQFKKKGLGLSWESDRDLVHYLVGDARRIMQVVVNLLSNALKHTTAGGVRVHISQESGGVQEDDLILALQVVDTGSGIPQDKLESIFESFTQLEETGQRSSGGAGLGLALCRRLARLMGGDVVAQSEPGRGSAFTFTAKLRRAPRDFEAEPAPAETVSTAASGYSVLAAEDNPLNAELLRHHLTALGHAPILVANGQEALDALAEKNFDLILMDMEMPVLDGLETTRRIRAGESGRNDPNIPIIAVTAHALPEYRKMCEQAGMSDYLPKPIRFNNLAEVLGRQLLPRT